MARDAYLCRVCAEKTELTRDKFVRHGLSVHHIVPLSEDFEQRLDDENLITLCAECHKKAETGEIARGILRRLAGRSVEISPP